MKNIFKRVIGIFLLLPMLTAMLAGCGLTVPNPEITEGEFAFTVTYSINGENQTVSGVYVCEYCGTDWALDGGAYRVWKGYTKGGGMEETFEIGTTEKGDKIELNLNFDPDYFMGDTVTGSEDTPAPYISVVLVDDEGLTFLCEPEEVAEVCDAKIISFEYAEPIENTFKK